MELLAGLIGAVVGFASKAITDVLTERRRREGEKRVRLIEATLKQALDFMEATAPLARSRQAVSIAIMALGGARLRKRADLPAISDTTETDPRERGLGLYGRRESTGAISLLIPAAAGTTRSYLDLCNDADAHPDEK